MINIGTENEKQLVKALNKVQFKKLNINLQNMIEMIFGPQKPTTKIHCQLTDNFIKPDIIVECDGKQAFISVKNNRAEIVHREEIKSFILFLRQFGISIETQKTLLLYQFGDGTMDGTGSKRMNYHEVYDWLHNHIDKANEELNGKFEIIMETFVRVLFQGVDITAQSADYIYYGTVDYGIIVSRKQLEQHLKTKEWGWYDNLHIGPILLKPHARYANKAVVDDFRRRQITFYWPKMQADLNYIGKRYNFRSGG